FATLEVGDRRLIGDYTLQAFAVDILRRMAHTRTPLKVGLTRNADLPARGENLPRGNAGCGPGDGPRDLSRRIASRGWEAEGRLLQPNLVARARQRKDARIPRTCAEPHPRWTVPETGDEPSAPTKSWLRSSRSSGSIVRSREARASMSPKNWRNEAI